MKRDSRSTRYDFFSFFFSSFLFFYCSDMFILFYHILFINNGLFNISYSLSDFNSMNASKHIWEEKKNGKRCSSIDIDSHMSHGIIYCQRSLFAIE